MPLWFHSQYPFLLSKAKRGGQIESVIWVFPEPFGSVNLWVKWTVNTESRCFRASGTGCTDLIIICHTWELFRKWRTRQVEEEERGVLALPLYARIGLCREKSKNADAQRRWSMGCVR